MSERRAVFLDRDGTLIEDVSYLHRPAQVRLLSEAAAAIKRLNEAGLLAIVVTNQSGIGRGLLSEADYLAGQRRVDELLAADGARIDAHYHCPHWREVDGPCQCRKPGPLLYEQASERFGIDLSASWWIGDRLRDVEAARLFGGRGILVLTGAGREEADAATAGGWRVAQDLQAAVGMILER